MTPEQIQQLDLAHDLLHTVKAWPEHVPSWWQLTSCVAALDDKAREGFLVHLRDLPLAGSQAQWYKLSALHCATRDPHYLVRQAQLAPALPDADRWMALANLVWWHALSDAPDRLAFRQLFIDTGVVALLDGLGRGLARTPRLGIPLRSVQRVAIFAQHLSTGSHAATALTFNLRALLEGAGIGTRVFASQELSLPAMRGHSAGGLVSNVAPMDPATWDLRMPGQVAVTAADVRFSALARWRSLEQSIERYDPDAVLFVGFFSPWCGLCGNATRCWACRFTRCRLWRRWTCGSRLPRSPTPISTGLGCRGPLRGIFLFASGPWSCRWHRAARSACGRMRSCW
ncbi:MAG: hypothetical protein ABI409_05455 [Ramlibacter sp.]